MPYDAESGLYHTWFRQYDPNQGRWMAVDPLAGSIVDPQSLNRYSYVRNDPVNLVDPLGLATCVYLTDDGEGIESIDYESTAEECEATGGILATGDDSVTVDGSGGNTGGTGPPPGGCADVYVDGIYVGNTCGTNGPVATGSPGAAPGGKP